MEGLFKTSLKTNQPVLIIYMAENLEITDRNIIARKIAKDYIRAYCLKRGKLQTFKRENILAAAKPRQKQGVRYA
ncbi:hypothetical protein RG959_23255 [Domibacillus sp. 8LH]|uniref:hypothetical protein n=1 Tax=Domibacillus sp. 8LH TaxID=3073900 RepID=UPI003180BCE7